MSQTMSKARKPRLILQPPKSQVCGHACIAMVAGITLNEAIEIIGHERATRWRELHSALTRLGITARNKMKPVLKRTKPRRAIVYLQNPENKRKAHWQLWWDGVKYDPRPGGSTWEATRYLEIKSED